jgi:hypothetical protein
VRPAQFANGVAARVNRCCSDGSSNTSPARHNTTAPAARTARVSIPSDCPKAATTKPVAVNASTRPADSASGARRCRCAADDSTIGTSGNTQGERMVKAPAT